MMTLEINEISVHISVSATPQGPDISMPSSLTPLPAVAALPAEQWDPVVQRCVREVLHHIRLKERR
jgi:hypothetical protein